MTFDQFDRFVDALRKFNENELKLSNTLSSFSEDTVYIDFCPLIVTAIDEYITEYFHDENEYQFYNWLYDQDFGAKTGISVGGIYEILCETRAQWIISQIGR